MLINSNNIIQGKGKICRVNVTIVVQFVEVQMCFNGFKVSGTTISEYFNT